MGGIVNYYHYSVYKLLVVNLTSIFESADPVQKKSGFGNAADLSAKRLRPGQPGVVETPTASSGTHSQPKTGPIVDKPLHIHRIECAELPHLNTAAFLSS
jgi:hypothetical protein